jgi:carbon storage regulator
MLVLSRRIGESIVVPGCDLTITISKIKGSQVRLAIEAPAHVAVHRAELLERLQHSWKDDSLSNAEEKTHERGCTPVG